MGEGFTAGRAGHDRFNGLTIHGMARRQFISCWLLLALLLGGCGRSPAPLFGPEFNSQRAKRGITLIGSGWVNYNAQNNANEAAWRPPEAVATTGARHSYKLVVYTGGQLQSETDYYLSGRTFPSSSPKGGTDFEGAAIEYSYEKERSGEDPWTCSIPTGKGSRPVSRAQFDATLATWGLKE
jgi:hypothetical protein